MADWLFLIPLLPLAAFAVNLLLGRGYIKDQAHWIAVPAVFVSWLLSLVVFFDVRDNPDDAKAISQELYTWIPAGDFRVEVNLFVDQLAAVMLLVVTTVGLLVHVYSIGYMRGDGGYYRFFSYLPLFVFSMLMLVLADNFLLLFVFWEAVGLCSYLLIGFWYKRRSAVNAAKKAFIVNRVGDLGFGLGIMLTFWTFGAVSFSDIFARVGEESERTLTWIALLLFLGACGKSAQFPLHVWLPDAMEGPTPVSALIHAATMVTAGIYMVARVHPIFEASEAAMIVVALVGAFTALMAATIALTQNDIKRVVAYSTLSQLGYMCFALGVGAWIAAIFHLMTHAFFKGLLFLGSGSVIHGLHEEQNIQRMGGLRKYMPLTTWTFVIAALANAGVVPLAGFWSKDEILVGSWISDSAVGDLVMVVGFVAAFFTALYMFRLVFLTFFGRERFDTAHVHPHEAPATMAVPLVLLAIPAAVIGFVGFPPEDGPIHHFLEPVFAGGEEAEGAEQASLYVLAQEASPEGEGAGATTDDGRAEGEEAAHGEEEHHVSTATIWTFGIISTIVALSGIAVAYLFYLGGQLDPRTAAARFPVVYRFLFNKWYFDELYDRVFVQPLSNLAMVLWRIIDEGIIDATVNGIANGIGALSQRLRHVQTGLVANYALAIALGMVLMVGIYLAGFSDLFR